MDRRGVLYMADTYLYDPGGGVLTYMSIICMCRGKDPPFLPDPHLRPPFVELGPHLRPPFRAVPAPKTPPPPFGLPETHPHRLIILTSQSKDNT